MQGQSTSIKTIIKRLQYLFLNKQLDQFIEIMQKEILPFVDGVKHHEKNKKKEEKKDNDVKNNENRQKDQKQQQNENKQKQVTKQSQQLKKKKQQITAALKQSSIHLLDKYQDMKLIISKLQHLTVKLQQPILQSTQWKINKLNAKSKIAVRTKGTQVEIKFQGLLEASIQNLIIMIYLIELYKQCVPFCSGSTNCFQPSPLQKIALLDFKFPFMTQRFAYFHGVAIDRITKNGKLYIYADGITNQQQMITKIYNVKAQDYQRKITKSVPLDVKHALCEISDAGNGEYLFRAFAFVDTHMPSLPSKAVNYIVKSMGGWVFDKILKKANNFKNSPWEKQMQENEKREKKDMFYVWLKERIGKWAKQGQKQKDNKQENEKNSKAKI